MLQGGHLHHGVVAGDREVQRFEARLGRARRAGPLVERVLDPPKVDLGLGDAPAEHEGIADPDDAGHAGRFLESGFRAAQAQSVDPQGLLTKQAILARPEFVDHVRVG